MKKSLRSIANTLFMLGILPFSASVMGTLAGNCGASSTNCLAGLSFGFDRTFLAYTPDTGVSQTTVAYSSSGITFAEIISAVQLVSLYALLVAVLILIALECVELYYIRQIFGKKLGTKRRAH